MEINFITYKYYKFIFNILKGWNSIKTKEKNDINDDQSEWE